VVDAMKERAGDRRHAEYFATKALWSASGAFLPNKPF
jgi:hypothetical protein